MFWKLIPVVVCIGPSFLSLAEESAVKFIIRIYHISFIHLSIDGHLGYFPFLVFVNNAVMTISCINFGVDVCFHFSWVDT